MARNDVPTLSDEATDWLMRVRDNPEDEAVRAGFEAWVLTSPQHRAEWERTCRAWQAMADLSRDLRSRAGQPARVAPPRRRLRTAIAGVAGGALTLCLAFLFAPGVMISLKADHRTSTGISREVVLKDGSKVLLAPDSALSLQFSYGKRGVTLLKGEAYFDVTRDVSRPFVVSADGLDVEVLGTSFDVRIGDEDSEVALVKGAIAAITPGDKHLLSPGEILSYDHRSGKITQKSADLADIGAWREGRLFVVDQTVASVAEQIQRYHSAWISIPDRVLAERRVTGIYDLSSPDEALGALVDPHGGKVRKVSDLVRILSRY